MQKLLYSVKRRPINFVLMVMVTILYLINNGYLKKNTYGSLQRFFICYFNDLICPLFFMSYSNFLLLTRGKEIIRIKSIIVYMSILGLIWEYFAPIIDSDSVTDVNDLFCYVLGGALYGLIIMIANCSKTRKNNPL